MEQKVSGVHCTELHVTTNFENKQNYLNLLEYGDLH